jgi:hypothetical protein
MAGLLLAVFGFSLIAPPILADEDSNFPPAAGGSGNIIAHWRPPKGPASSRKDVLTFRRAAPL